MSEQQTTPSNNNRTRRKSSSRKSLGGCGGANNAGGSASKIIRLMIEKEKKRKLNHYRSAKLKRAEVFESRRRCVSDALAEPIDFDRGHEDPNITDDNEDSLISLDLDNNDRDTNKTMTIIPVSTPMIDEVETTIRVEEEQKEDPVEVGANEKIEEDVYKPTEWQQQVTKASGIGSRIASRLYSIKNSIKKMVASGGSTRTYTVNETMIDRVESSKSSSVVRSLNNDSSNTEVKSKLPAQLTDIPPKPREVTFNLYPIYV